MNNSGNTKIIDKTLTLNKQKVWIDEHVIRMSFKKLKDVYLDYLGNY